MEHSDWVWDEVTKPEDPVVPVKPVNDADKPAVNDANKPVVPVEPVNAADKPDVVEPVNAADKPAEENNG
jgi:hypothetical protein